MQPHHVIEKAPLAQGLSSLQPASAGFVCQPRISIRERLVQQPHPRIKRLNQLVNLLIQPVDARPVRRVIPLGHQLFIRLALLLDPGVVLQVCLLYTSRCV